jgi:hypothetical protein
MSQLSGITEIELVAEESPNLDTNCFRGSAPLAHLALISQPDVFDQETNPEGLQRDLSPKHASEAYEYAHRNAEPGRPRAFPEVVLNVRDKNAVKVDELEGGPDDTRHVRLRFTADQGKRGKVSVSRVDGNHRLFFTLPATRGATRSFARSRFNSTSASRETRSAPFSWTSMRTRSVSIPRTWRSCRAS